MKIKRIVLPLAVSLLVALILCSCSAGFTQDSFKDGRAVPSLDPSEIESASLWRKTDGKKETVDFTDKQIEEFASLFNRATVRIRDGGTTPAYSLTVNMKNGTVFTVIDCEELLELQFVKIEGKTDFTRSDEIKIVSDDLMQFIKNVGKG